MCAHRPSSLADARRSLQFGTLPWYQQFFTMASLCAGASYTVVSLINSTEQDEAGPWNNILSGFVIRDAKREDNQALLVLSKQCAWGMRWSVTADHGPHWAHHVLRLDSKPAVDPAVPWKQDETGLPATVSFIKVAETKATQHIPGQVVAVCTGALQPVRDPAGRLRLLGTIVELQVLASHRRRGIGSTLLHAVEKSLVKAGFLPPPHLDPELLESLVIGRRRGGLTTHALRPAERGLEHLCNLEQIQARLCHQDLWLADHHPQRQPRPQRPGGRGLA